MYAGRSVVYPSENKLYRALVQFSGILVTFKLTFRISDLELLQFTFNVQITGCYDDCFTVAAVAPLGLIIMCNPENTALTFLQDSSVYVQYVFYSVNFIRQIQTRMRNKSLVCDFPDSK